MERSILIFCSIVSVKIALVTYNRRSMGKHIADHFLAGHQHWGIFEVPNYLLSIGEIAEMLYLYWATTEAGAVKNGIIYIS